MRRHSYDLVQLSLLAVVVLSSGAQAQVASDERLDARITLTFSRTSVGNVMKSISEATGVPIRVDREIADDWVTCLVNDVPARGVLQGVSSALVLKPEAEGKGYHLRLSPIVEQLQVNRARALRLRDEELLSKRSDAIRRGMEQTLDPEFSSENDAEVSFSRTENPEVLSFLRPLTGEQRTLLTTGAAEPPGVIGSSGAAHLNGRIYFLRRLSTLSPELRLQAGGLLAKADPNTFVLQPGDDPLVGITTYEGCLGLSFVNGDQVYNTPAAPFGGMETRALQVNGSTAVLEAAKAIERFNDAERGWLDPVAEGLPPGEGMGWKMAPIQIRLEAPGVLGRADRVLAEFSRCSGISIIGDSFTASTFVPNARNLEIFSDPAAAAIWARRIARAFGRKYRISGGTLLLRSRNPVVDRAIEPPPALIMELVDALRRSGRLELREYVRASSGMTVEQLRVLGLFSTEEGWSLGPESLILERNRPLLTLLGTLSGNKERNWEQGSIGDEELPQQAWPLFQRLYWTGRPQLTTDGSRLSWRTEGDRVLTRFRRSAAEPASVHELVLRPKRMGVVPVKEKHPEQMASRQ